MQFNVLKNGLNECGELWRYLNIHRFIALFEPSRLYFRRLDLYEDKFEGITYELTWDNTRAKLPHNLNPYLSNEEKQRIAKEQEIAAMRINSELPSMQKKRYISSWINSCRESIAMWNIYSDRDSVAISVNGHDFISKISRLLELQPYFYSKCQMVCGQVVYLPINPVGPEVVDSVQTDKDPLYSGFVKDQSFQHEQEFRFLIADDSKQLGDNEDFTMELTNDFWRSITVHTHPQMDKWKFNNIEILCDKFGLKSPIRSVVELRK